MSRKILINKRRFQLVSSNEGKNVSAFLGRDDFSFSAHPSRAAGGGASVVVDVGDRSTAILTREQFKTFLDSLNELYSKLD
jgi:hypothetical protein